MKTAILIPARYGSTRFPGKPLTKLGDRHMIQEVYVKCKNSGLDTYVLTDHPLIVDLFADKTVVIDQSPYENGTERCAGALKDPRFDQYDKFINVQGDMPDVTAEMIYRVDEIVDQGVVTLWTDMSKELQSDPNCVKVVHNNVRAHWFGRGLTLGDQHLGVYGYTREMLEKYGTKQDKYENHEGLEQLRWIAMGHKVYLRKVTFNGIEINTPEDAEKWNERDSR
jgi:3-deoxy-manno-octulosonate cytidylyltransferase (CMP-KDO synthetase)